MATREMTRRGELLTDALEQVRWSRATYDRCPSKENAQTVEACEEHLNYLLDNPNY